MKTIFLLLGIVIGLASALILRTVAGTPETPHHGVVVKVLSGDTVRLLDGRTIRLAWVKAPPLDQPGGMAAARALDAVALDRRVVLVNPQPDGDRHWTATVLLDGDRDAAWLLLKGGWVRHHDHAGQSPAEAELYGFAHAEARENGRGLWPARKTIHPRDLRRGQHSACGDATPPAMPDIRIKTA